MTMDLFWSQLRIALMALIAFAAGKGWFTTKDASLATELLTTLGPIAAPYLWSLYSNMNVKKVPTTSIAVDVGVVPTLDNAPHLLPGQMATVTTKDGQAAGRVVG